MTEDTYQTLREVLLSGCMPERRSFIESLSKSPGLLFAFTERLTMDTNTPSQCETWRFLAQVCAIVGSDYVARVDGIDADNPCPDPHNPDCCCAYCEATEDVEGTGRTPIPVAELNRLFGKPKEKALSTN